MPRYGKSVPVTPPRHCWCLELGLMEFVQAHGLQLEILEAKISGRMKKDIVLLVEHPAVFTMGRRGKCTNLKAPPSFLSDSGIGLHRIERGGDITFHGPGQLVAYPIMNLKQSNIGVLDFVDKLEESMIRTLTNWGIRATRDSRNRGVWVNEKKIGSVGIAIRRGISFHGMALNVNLPLEPFSWINPCGLEGIGVTAMSLEARKPVAVMEVKAVLKKHFEDIFSILIQDINIFQVKEMMR